MKIESLSKEEVLFFCQKDEDHFYDKKAFGIKGDKIQKIAVAFANADGGEIVVGVADEKENPDPLMRWCGAQNTEKYNGVIQALSEPEPSIDFRFKFLKKRGDLNKYILHVTINKGLEVHQTSKKEVYIRKGAQSLPVKGSIKIMELAHAKGIRSVEDDFIESASIDEIESSKALKSYVGQLPVKDIQPLDFLLKQNLIHRETWYPSVAAILLFSDNPSSVLPKQCALKIARYETDKEQPERSNLKETIAIEGPLIEIINDAFNTIRSILKSIEVWTVKGKKGIYYPDETLWEILVNSVLHRDYSISDNVLVSIYDNRIEFLSPGRLPGFVTPENILDNRFSRNSKLVRILSKYSTSPNKDLGEGINTAFQEMKKAGLKYPSICEEGNYVRVTISHIPLEDPKEIILDFIEHNKAINNKQARDLLGTNDSNKVTRLFNSLKLSEKIIKSKEKGKIVWKKI